MKPTSRRKPDNGHGFADPRQCTARWLSCPLKRALREPHAEASHGDRQHCLGPARHGRQTPHPRPVMSVLIARSRRRSGVVAYPGALQRRVCGAPHGSGPHRVALRSWQGAMVNWENASVWATANAAPGAGADGGGAGASGRSSGDSVCNSTRRRGKRRLSTGLRPRSGEAPASATGRYV